MTSLAVSCKTLQFCRKSSFSCTWHLLDYSYC